MGELHPNSRLTTRDVREIRRRYIKGRDSFRGNGALLAEEYGITRSMVARIAKRDAWRHIDEE